MNAHLAITEPVTITLFEIQEPHEQPDEYSAIRDGWSDWDQYNRYAIGQ